MGAGSLTVRFDDGDKAIERGARLLVSEGQVAQFVYMGKYGDLFGPGEHILQTDNIPIITALKSWKYGFESPFKADIYFVATKLFSGCKWGTAHPVMVQDSRLGVVRLRAHGTYDFRVTNIPLFLSQVAGTDHNFTLVEFEETMRTRVASAFSQALALSGIEASLVATKHHELGAAFLSTFNATISGLYGVELAAFAVESVSLPEEVERMLDSGAGIRALGGDIQTYLQVQLARGMGGGGGALSAPTELALGLTAARMIGTGGGAGFLPEPPDSRRLDGLHDSEIQSIRTLPAPKEYYSPTEAAEVYGLPPEVLERAVSDGEIPSYILLGHRVIKAEDLRSAV
jgi:membrane protease subunit (stomatin/prohibitin family)